MQDVLGFERFGDVEFHTQNIKKGNFGGSGLKSTVMWDPASGIKFANNEPAAPFFKSSQIYIFCEDHRGPGVQHVALAVTDILSAVRAMRRLQILIDGNAANRYLLQIFMRDAAGTFNDPQAGPLFLELIQRKGDEGFGAGNFRALFESIERQQQTEGRG